MRIVWPARAEWEPRDVPDGVDVLVACSGMDVNHDAVVDLDPGLLRELGGRLCTDARYDYLGLQRRPVGQGQTGAAAGRLGRHDRRPQDDPHPLRGMVVREEGRDRRRDAAGHDAVSRLDDGDLTAQLSRRGGHLHADHARPDDNQPGRGRETAAQAVAVGEGAGGSGRRHRRPRAPPASRP